MCVFFQKQLSLITYQFGFLNFLITDCCVRFKFLRKMFFGYFSLKFSNAKIPKQSIEYEIGVSQSSGRDEDACHFRLNSFNNCAKSVLWMTCRLKDCHGSDVKLVIVYLSFSRVNRCCFPNCGYGKNRMRFHDRIANC